MAKGRSKGSSSSSNSYGNGGIGGSGIFGHVGTTVHCDENSKSAYCRFMKFINVIIGILILMAIIFFFYPIIVKYYKKFTKSK
jgi:hypothetical protein